MTLMFEIYLFFAAFQFLATIFCALLCYKISKLEMTPTLTFKLLAIAFSMRIMSQIHGFLYVKDVVEFYKGYSTTLIVGSNLFGALTIALFLMAFFRIYVGLKEKGIK